MKPMTRFIASAAVLILSANTALAGSAAPTVLNFDNLAGYADMAPTNYGGFSWTSWFHYDQDQAGLPYFAHTPDTRVTPLSNFNSISSASPFVFTGAYISGFAAATLHYQLSLGGVVVANLPTFHPNASASTWQPSGYAGNVDSVSVIADAAHINYFVLDDFTYSAASPVAEPDAGALLAAGLAALGVVMRRKANAAR
jgi:hypothetical protein